MKPLNLTSIARWVNAKSQSRYDPELIVSSVSTDSRRMSSDALFVPLSGPQHDGHDYISQAFERGASATLCSREMSPEMTNCILVDDTLKALQCLALNIRLSASVKVVGVTGSSGKTSVKDLVSLVLSGKNKVSKTQGNLNNHIGVPLSILNSGCEDNFWVIEMGMSNRGEISALCDIARPDVGIITNIGVAHIENLGSRQEIAFEKTDLAASLPDDGLVIYNGDCEFSKFVRERSHCKVLSVGFNSGNDCIITSDGWNTEKMMTEFSLQYKDGATEKYCISAPGRHMILNASYAIALARFTGMSVAEIQNGLDKWQPPSRRQNIIRTSNGCIIDDTYNSNPDSATCALETLVAVGSRAKKIVVLGAMAELGEQSKAMHFDIGAKVQAAGASMLLTIGDHSEEYIKGAVEGGMDNSNCIHFENMDQLIRKVKEVTMKDYCILVKGSRKYQMERVVDSLVTGGQKCYTI